MDMFGSDFLQVLLDPSTLEGALFYAFVVGISSFVLARIFRDLIQRLFIRETKAGIDRTAIAFISQFTQFIIVIFAAVLYFHLIPSLRAFGTAVLATAGFASIVIGPAAQNTLGNIISGISLLIYRPIRVRDRVKVYASSGDETGVVETIGLGYTVFVMPDDEKIVVPNSVLASTVIVNYGKDDPEKS